MRFSDRTEAGQRLAERLLPLAGENVVVVGLPRGGVPVAFEVADALHAPLDVIVVRKLGVPFQPELGMGAVGERGVRIINEQVVRQAQLSAAEFAEVEQRERDAVQRRVRRLRGDRPAVALTGRTVVVVDDGIATGSTARAACQVARAMGASRVVLAVPVGPRDINNRIGPVADEVVCLRTPVGFSAVGQAYVDFRQTTDQEVVDLLERATRGVGVHVESPQGEITVPAGGVRLAGQLTVPAGAEGLVVFVHGSGSSRHSPRNLYVADFLNAAGLGTLLFDLLTLDEEVDRGNVFDIALLGRRLRDVTAWLRSRADVPNRIGYFGASTGAAAALNAAADPEADIAAVVSRGGRPDLAGPKLELVRAPTLFIVGGYDDYVLALNRVAQDRLRCESRLEIVPGATHLFAEPGALGAVACLARDWFTRHLVPALT